MDWVEVISLALVAAGAATLGSMLGLGGGVFIVPIFTLFFGIDEKLAIGASAVAVVTNSVVGSSNHLRARFTNIRLAMLLQVTTATGALIGASFAVNAPETLLNGIFGAVLVYAAVSMLVRRRAEIENSRAGPDPWNLGATYDDTASGEAVSYIPKRLPAGLSVSGGAGVLSGMLGVGGGVILVPAMNLLMRVPVKAAAGTSTFMVGITAVATAFVFYSDDKIDSTIVVPAIIGTMVGSQFGSKLTRRVRTQNLVMLFVSILLYLGLSLVLKSFGVTLPGQQ